MRTDLLRLRLAAFLAVLMLAGCGPGSGGTGLPPAASGLPAASGEAPGAGDRPPQATAPPPGGASTGGLLAPVSGEPELVGRVEAIDAVIVRVGTVDIELARVDVQRADATPAPVSALVVGLQVQVWRVGDRVVLRLFP